jgi:hypothetical protein
METFDLDLEDLDLKPVDINSNNNNNTINNYGSSQPSMSPARPNLSVSSGMHDSLPSMSFSTDKEVDFGLSMLVNKKKQRHDSNANANANFVNKMGSASAPPSTNPSPTPKSFFNSNDDIYGGGGGGGSGNGMGSISFPQKVNLDDTEMLQSSLFYDNMTNIDLDKELSSLDIGDVKSGGMGGMSGMSGPKLPDFNSSNSTNIPGLSTNSSYGVPPVPLGNTSNYGSINTGGIANSAGLSYEDVQKAKFDLLCKFERLRDKGVKIPKVFSMSSDYDEMKYEYDRLIHQRKMANSVKMQRQMLVTFCSGMTFLNDKFDPIGLKLEGFDEHVNDNVGDYDDIFEELYEKYKESANMAPELKLLMTLGGSAFMYHLSNSVFKSAMPNPSDILKQNPELMRQFQAAAMGAVNGSNPGFANFMGGMMGGGGGGGDAGPPKYNPMGGPPFANPRDAPPRGQTNVNDTEDIDKLLNSLS